MEQKIITAILKQLKRIDSGEFVNIGELVRKTKLVDKVFTSDMKNMLAITYEIFAAAEREGIYLESVLGEDAVVGMPYSFTYVIKRKYSSEQVNRENCIGVSFQECGMIYNANSRIVVNKADVASAEWERLMDTVFNRCKVQDWYDNYINYCILDGTDWELELKFSDGSVARYSGSNDAPEELDTLVLELRKVV